MQAILLISHGSHSPKTKQEIIRLTDLLRSKVNVPIVEFAFLEIEFPNIPDGIDMCVSKGAQEVYLLLNFLNSGKHVDRDIPRMIEEAKKKYPEIKFSLSQPIGQHPKIVDLFTDFIHQ